ncbi:hypothetical protein C1X64_37685, partial [Pseudomonas sp. GW456-E7]
RPKFNLEPIPGRVIIQKEELYFAQMFLPVDADDDISMFNGLKSDVQHLQERFASMEQPAPIPMLPESLSTREFSLRFKLERKPLSVP